MSAKAQRLRITYARGQPVRYVSHLDMMRFWERALRRARLPLAYSEGFSPHAQIAMAAPLSVGQTSRADLLDIYLATSLPPDEVQQRLQAQMPAGIELSSVVPVEVAGPSLQSLLRAADYALCLRMETDICAVRRRIDSFLAADTFPWELQREREVRKYDLRPLVLSLELHAEVDEARITMRLRADTAGTGRPDQLAAALGLTEAVAAIERVALIMSEPIPSA